jgi:integrase
MGLHLTGQSSHHFTHYQKQHFAGSTDQRNPSQNTPGDAAEVRLCVWDGNGGHIGDIKRSFTSACRKAGITDFRFHDLRHTYASHLAMRGVHIRALQELFDHKSVIMTQHHSHLAPEQLQNAVKLLDGLIGGRQQMNKQVSS